MTKESRRTLRNEDVLCDKVGDEFSQLMKDTAPATNEWSKPLLLPFMDEECEKRFRELMIAAGVITADGGEVNETAKGEVEALLGFRLEI